MPAAGVGVFTVIVPVDVVQVGCVAVAVGVAGDVQGIKVKVTERLQLLLSSSSLLTLSLAAIKKQYVLSLTPVNNKEVSFI